MNEHELQEHQRFLRRAIELAACKPEKAARLGR